MGTNNWNDNEEKCQNQIKPRTGNCMVLNFGLSPIITLFQFF